MNAEASPVRIISQQNGYARTTYLVEMPQTIYAAYMPQQIVNIVDGGCDLRQANVQNNFGGTVTQLTPDLYRVVVFTD